MADVVRKRDPIARRDWLAETPDKKAGADHFCCSHHVCGVQSCLPLALCVTGPSAADWVVRLIEEASAGRHGKGGATGTRAYSPGMGAQKRDRRGAKAVCRRALAAYQQAVLGGRRTGCWQPRSDTALTAGKQARKIVLHDNYVRRGCRMKTNVTLKLDAALLREARVI